MLLGVRHASLHPCPLVLRTGIFQSGLSSSACAVWALAGGDKSSIMPVRHIPGIFGVTWDRALSIYLDWCMDAIITLAAWTFVVWCAGYGTPAVSLMLHVVIVLVLNLASFEALVEADMLLTVCGCKFCPALMASDVTDVSFLAGCSPVPGVCVLLVASQKVGTRPSLLQGAGRVVGRVGHHHS